MMTVLHHIWCRLTASLSMSFYMGWSMLWALVLGFTLSAIIQAIVTRPQMNKWLANHSFKSLAAAALFGAASSSCSYAAAAITRSLIKQGADFTTAMAFQFASTNLVLELGVLLALLLGWQFTLAQFIGGIIMIVVMSLLFQFFLPKKLIASATTGVAGSVNLAPTQTSISHYFFMDWASLWSDILLGLVVAGVLSAWIPDSFWITLFCKDNSAVAHLVNPLIGPLIAILSFVCSIGNVPMAAVLWQHGMTFGGVLSFLFADLIVFPLLNIYRKYYGLKMATYLAVIFYVSMVAAAYCCESLFTTLGLLPPVVITPDSHMMMSHAGIGLNYTTGFNIVALIFAGLLFKRFYQTGGLKIFRKHSCHL